MGETTKERLRKGAVVVGVAVAVVGYAALCVWADGYLAKRRARIAGAAFAEALINGVKN